MKEITMSRFSEIIELVQSFEKDFVKFYEKDNKSAGTRVRKHMNELKKKAQEVRKEVQEKKGIGEVEVVETITATEVQA